MESQGEEAITDAPKKMKLTPLAKAMNKPTNAMAVATEFDTSNPSLHSLHAHLSFAGETGEKEIGEEGGGGGGGEGEGEGRF